VGADARGPEVQPQALAGLTVVELPCLDTLPFLAASMAAKSFADFGAEVIKVEPPRVGARERSLGPFREGTPDPETGGLHLFLNTNKQSVTLDFASARGRDLLLRLLDGADIVFNPNTPPFNDRIGLGWRELIARFPKLIVVSVTFFGADSPYREHRGGDLVATHMSGVGYDTPYNQVTDLEKHPPLKLGGRQSDYLTGYAAASGAMCALFARKKSGAGQHVDVSQWLAMVSMMRPSLGVYTHEGKEAPGFKRLSIRQKAGPQWVFPCKDGWVSLSVATDRFWGGAKRAMGNPEWMEQEIFQTLPGRAAHVDAIEAAAMDWLSTRTRREAFERFQAEHVPCFPVHSPAEVAADVHMEAREFFADHRHPAAGEVRMPGAPCRMSRTPWRIKRGAPRLGEHNRAIFTERLKMTDKELAALAEERIV
jgi:crotonobetainyl-CoA:carnitine CoA-transferase CaiB-like acyl-CoA transferase